jgi:hypothetical protein
MQALDVSALSACMAEDGGFEDREGATFAAQALRLSTGP